MKITIYTSSGTERTTVTPSDSSVHQVELMTSDYVRLDFFSSALFSLGDYIIYKGNKYELNEVAKPKSDGGKHYSYSLQFDAEWLALDRCLFFYNRQSGREKKWSLTNYAAAFLDLIVANAADAGLGTYTYEIDSSVTAMQYIEFDGVSLLNALTLIADAWECDWWIDSNIIHLGDCRVGTAVNLAVGEALQTLSATESSEKRITRLYAYGSTRNLPTNYRKDADAEATIEGVVERRLKLPAGTDHIDTRGDLTSSEIVEGVKVFEDVYPHYDGHIDIITTKEYTDTTENDDGTTTSETWLAYRIVDNSIRFSRDYQLEGQTLEVQFTSGLLTGMRFAVEFNPDNNPEDSTGGQEFEIIRNDDYGIKLPNDTICPAVGDGYVLSGWDATRIGELGLVDAAEQELLTTATEWLAKYGNSSKNYEAKTNPIWCAGYRKDNSGYTYNSANEVDLELGQVVTLTDTLLLGDRTYTSRVRAYEKSIISAANATYTIGESSDYSKTADIQQQVDGIVRGGAAVTTSGCTSTKLITRYDTSPESDSTAYSSLRTKAQYLDKTKPDTAAETITFLKGIVTDNVISSDFISGLLGFKFSNQDGISYGEIDDLMVRRRAIFISLAIKEMRHIGGAVIISPASAKIEKVEEGSSGYKCYFKGTDGNQTIDNFFYRDDLVMCRTYSNNYNTRYYWRRCTSFSPFPDDEGYLYIVLSKTDCASDSDAPQAGDSVVTFGSKGSEFRQSVIILNSEGNNAPYFQQLRGINDYGITDANILTELGQQNNIIRGEKIELVTEDGNIGMDYMFSAIVQNAESITSVVSKQEAVGKEYTSSQWVGNDGFNYYPTKNTNEYYVVYSKDPQNYYDHCTRLTIENVKKGDKIHIEGKSMFIRIIGCDGDAQGADTDFGNDYPSDINDFTALGFGGDLYDEDGISVVDWVATDNWEKVYIMLTDDSPYAYQTAKVTLIRSAYTAESRIEQTAENIKLAVGETGINIDAKTISLSASNTIVSGDLSVQRVNAYDSNGNLLSSYNGNGNGTIIYYYPSGYKMREDAFVYDSNGDIVGMMTIYYKADGSVAWTITETGFSNTLADYWVNLGVVNYTTDETALINVLKEYLGESLNYLNKQTFSRFVSNSTKYEAYNGKVAAGTKSSETPTSVTLWAGVLVYNVELVSGGLIPTYAVTYEVVTSATNQVSLTVNRKFNMTGWID